MPQNFMAVDRDQVLLMPPSLQEWLPAEHYAWFVLASVEQVDLSAFLAGYRPDGHGRPAHGPALMVALLITRIHAGCVRRARSSVRAWKKSRSEWSQRTRRLIMRLSLGSAGGMRRRSRGCSPRCLSFAPRLGWRMSG
jgi:hypothetical protein